MKIQKHIVTIGVIFLLSCSEKIDKTMTTEKSNNPENTENTETSNEPILNSGTGSLGAFSMSLSVKDLAVSKKFYEDLGFTVKGGSMEMNYLVMKNGNTLIGLFQGMFDENIITFNPGWDENGAELDNFTDVRDIQQDLQEKGYTLNSKADSSTSGPASIMLKDPAVNILFTEQHREAFLMYWKLIR